MQDSADHGTNGKKRLLSTQNIYFEAQNKYQLVICEPPVKALDSITFNRFSLVFFGSA